MKKVGLSLCGGGFKAPLYLGVIKALEENDIPIDIIGGLSAGSLLGGMYAMGKSVDEISQIAFNIDYYALLDINPFNGWTILNPDKVYRKLKEIVGDIKIEDLKKKYIVLASDIDTKEPVIIKKGELANAMMASCALPPIMPPHLLGGKYLVDGGFAYKFGAKHFREAGADVVIGVNLDQWLTDNQLPGIVRDAIRSIRIVIESNAKYEKQFDPIDLEINHFENKTTMIDFENMKLSLVDEGYKKGMEYIHQIKKLIK